MPKPDKESVREEDDRTVPPDDTDQNTSRPHSARQKQTGQGCLRERKHNDKFGAISVMEYQYHLMLYNKWKEKRWHLNNGEHSLIKLNNYS